MKILKPTFVSFIKFSIKILYVDNAKILACKIIIQNLLYSRLPKNDKSDKISSFIKFSIKILYVDMHCFFAHLDYYQHQIFCFNIFETFKCYF
jgi:hypothetical protein